MRGAQAMSTALGSKHLKKDSRLHHSLKQEIGKRQKNVTIVFTDIIDSTHYWHHHGDVQGRLMVDRLNRILFLMVKRFNGRVVKTIGDSVMALFYRNTDALDASIAIQQALSKLRHEESDFVMRVRIGMHSGEAIVEENDVFGDVVNVAARIESQSSTDGIYLNEWMTNQLPVNRYYFTLANAFVPKGKDREMQLFHCQWTNHKNLIKDVRLEPILPIGRAQRAEVLGYFLSVFALMYYLYVTLIQYILLDSDRPFAILLSPMQVYKENEIVVLTLLTIVFSIGLHYTLKIQRIPVRLLRGLKGAFVGAVLMVVTKTVIAVAPFSLPSFLKHDLYTSQHSFIHIHQDNTPILNYTNLTSETLGNANARDIYLETNRSLVDGKMWYKIMVDTNTSGWVRRAIPAKMGAAEVPLATSKQAHFKVYDLLIFLLGGLGFLWGYLSFRVKPIA